MNSEELWFTLNYGTSI